MALNKLLFEPDTLPLIAKTAPTEAQRALGQRYTPLPHPPVTKKWVSPAVGYGIFALEELPAHLCIGEYTGIVRCPSSLHPLNDYAFKYPVLDTLGRFLEINAEPCGNFTRYINHSFTPNLDTHYVYTDTFHALLVTRRPIAAGEELRYDYGRNYWLLRAPPQ